MELCFRVGKFYSNNASMLKNMNPSGKDKDMKKQSILNTIWVQDTKVDISIRGISSSLFGVAFEMTEESVEYNFLMNDLKRVRRLSVGDKMMHYRCQRALLKLVKMPHDQHGHNLQARSKVYCQSLVVSGQALDRTHNQ